MERGQSVFHPLPNDIWECYENWCRWWWLRDHGPWCRCQRGLSGCIYWEPGPRDRRSWRGCQYVLAQMLTLRRNKMLYRRLTSYERRWETVKRILVKCRRLPWPISCFFCLLNNESITSTSTTSTRGNHSKKSKKKKKKKCKFCEFCAFCVPILRTKYVFNSTVWVPSQVPSLLSACPLMALCSDRVVSYHVWFGKLHPISPRGVVPPIERHFRVLEMRRTIFRRSPKGIQYQRRLQPSRFSGRQNIWRLQFWALTCLCHMR